MTRKHALLAPSSAYRWMNCPGSVALCKDLPEDDNEFSAEGTAAHTLATWCLTEHTDTAAYLGRVIKVSDEYEFVVDGEMAQHVQTYVSRVREYARLGTLLVEQSVAIDHVTGEENAEGTSDAIIVADNGDELQVHDLKYGRGVRVDAGENPQLMLYALGAFDLADMLGFSPKRLRLVIHQPRLDHLSEWDCTVEHLGKFAQRAKERAFHALATLNEKPEALVHHLQPSDKACMFCKAKDAQICPKLDRFIAETVGADFEVLADTANGPAYQALGVPVDLIPTDAAGLGTKMDAIELIEDWCRAVRAKVESELLAGNAVPSPSGGYKLVQGKRGNRAWSSEEEAEKKLKSFRLKDDQMYTRKLITPTAAEGLLKEQPKRWKKLVGIITQPSGKPSVAPMSDKRPALAVGKAEDDFEVIADGADLA